MTARRAAVCLTFLLGTTVASLSKTPAVPAVDMDAAPADQYFGPQKMSAIGIRMRIDSLGRRYHAGTLAGADLVHDATIAETSFRAWNARYPRDPWLAPTAFHLEQLFALVPSPDARAQAVGLLHFIDATFANTKYGHLSRLRLAQGFPPLPSAPPAPAASPAPATSASDGSGAQNSASPLPSSAPEAVRPGSTPRSGFSPTPKPRT